MTLEHASVDFWRQGARLARPVEGWLDSESQAFLDSLVESLFPSVEYTFKHALTHDVAYGTLLQERRRALHARIVVAIEQLHGDRLAEHVERLAHHALRGEVWDKAVNYLRQGHYRRAEFVLKQNVEALETAWGEAEGIQASISYVTSSCGSSRTA